MTLDELVDVVWKNFENVTPVRPNTQGRRAVSKLKIKNAILSMQGAIKTELKKGGRLEIENFGVFKVSKYIARPGRNPRTGTSIRIKEKNVPIFKPSRAFRDFIQ